MSAEILHVTKERVVKMTALTTVVIAASSASVLAAKELSRRKAEDKRLLEEGNRNSGDFGGEFSGSG
ncbi:MAG: hypothetical protein M1365_03975 [Actinobacteria bacterium]|nr:hypothetical protein [Actinomycetota bacterium]